MIICKKHFMYLIKNGYEIFIEKDTMVSYKKSKCEIQIMFDSISCEISSNFVWNNKKTFSLQDILDYVKIEGLRGIYQIKEKGQIELGICYLEKAIEEVLNKIDISKEREFLRVYAYRLKTRERLLKEYYIKTALIKADEYWDSKQFKKAEELYNKYFDWISETQKKRLNYIRNKF